MPLAPHATAGLPASPPPGGPHRSPPSRRLRRPLALAVLALCATASGMTVVSDATLSSSSSSGASVAAGTAVVSSSQPGQAVVAAGGMRPGDSRSGTVEIANAGDVPARLTLRAAARTDTPSSPALSSVVSLTVVDVASGASVYTGKLADLSQAALGTFAAGEQRTYELRLVWPAASTDPALQGAGTSLTLSWSAET